MPWLGGYIIFWRVKFHSLEVNGDFDFTNFNFNNNNSIDFLLIGFSVRELSSSYTTFWDRDLFFNYSYSALIKRFRNWMKM